jgi:hypothetical protein
MNKYLFLFSIALTVFSCHKNENIQQLLNSDKPWEVIRGAYAAGETGDKKYIPFLLHDAGNWGRSTELEFKGYSVYQEKMIALKKILHQIPPDTITRRPDSTNIKFYNDLWQKMNKSK